MISQKIAMKPNLSRLVKIPITKGNQIGTVRTKTAIAMSSNISSNKMQDRFCSRYSHVAH